MEKTFFNIRWQCLNLNKKKKSREDYSTFAETINREYEKFKYD